MQHLTSEPRIVEKRNINKQKHAVKCCDDKFKFSAFSPRFFIGISNCWGNKFAEKFNLLFHWHRMTSVVNFLSFFHSRRLLCYVDVRKPNLEQIKLSRKIFLNSDNFFPHSMINDTTFRNYFLIFLIKFLSLSTKRNKLNLTCQNRHYSNAPAAEIWKLSVCRGQQPSDGKEGKWEGRKVWKLDLTSWRMFRHSQYFIGFCFGSRLPSSPLSFVRSLDCLKCEVCEMWSDCCSRWNIPLI